MKAVVQDRFGGPEVLSVRDVAVPEPLGTEVLVRVRAAGVNPVDWKTRGGNGFLREFPMTLGWDLAGTVERVADGVTRFAPGDRVFGMPWFPRPAGAYAEFVTSPARQLARTPTALDDIEAAGLPMAGLTAWQALVDTMDVRAGQRVLITGATGGVGHLAVQIARARGAHVIATARAEREAFVRDLGAHEVLDHSTLDVPASVDSLDAIFDPAGAYAPRRWLDTLSDGGRLVSFARGREEAAAEGRERGISVDAILVEPDGHALEQLAELACTGRLRVAIHATHPLEDVATAHRMSEAGRVTGKIVLRV